MTDVGVGMIAGLFVNSDTPNLTTESTTKDDLRLPEFESVLSNAKKSFEYASDSKETVTSQSSKLQENSVDSSSEKKEVKSVEKKFDDCRKSIEKKLMTDSDSSPEVDEQNLASVLQQYQTLLREVVANGFGISPEELDEAMVEQGMTMADLLDVSKLAQLFQTIQEDFSMADVLVDQEFLGTMQEISDLTLSTLEELDISLEEFVNEFASELNLQSGEQAEEMEVAIEEEDSSIVVNQESLERKVASGIQTVFSDEDSVEMVEEKPQEVNEEMIEALGTDEETNNPDESMLENDDDSEMQHESKKINLKESHSEILHQTRMFDGPQQIANVESMTIEEPIKVVELQNLVSELTEYLQLHSTGTDISSIEMQLNPANLGKVLVEVSTNNGEVTTKIATQTEAAKEALEASVTQLRDNLEQQGIKVNAVEVTVETHEFEQNLQQDGSREQQQLERELQEKLQRRNLNLNLNEMTLDDLQGLMSEEDMVIAKMMRDNGNVINIGA